MIKANRLIQLVIKNKKEEGGVVGEYNDSESDEFFYCLSPEKVHDSWILDFICSYHISYNKEWFSSYESVKGGAIVVGNNSK